MKTMKLIRLAFALLLALLVVVACGDAPTGVPVAVLSTATPTAAASLTPTATPTLIPSAEPTSAPAATHTPSATPTMTPYPTALLVRDSNLLAGPASQGYESIGTLEAGTAVAVLGAFGDFCQVQAALGDGSPTGFVLKDDIDALPSSLAELDVDAVPWQPVEVMNNFFDWIAVIKDGSITVDNSGYDGYYDYHGRPFTMETAFSITVKVQTSDGQYGSIKLQDSPNVESEL